MIPEILRIFATTMPILTLMTACLLRLERGLRVALCETCERDRETKVSIEMFCLDVVAIGVVLVLVVVGFVM
jgi:hypothetical protein